MLQIQALPKLSFHSSVFPNVAFHSLVYLEVLSNQNSNFLLFSVPEPAVDFSVTFTHTHTHTHFLAGTVLPNTFYLFTQTKITFYGTQRGTDYTIGSVRTIGHWPSSLRAQKIHKPITHLQPASVWGLLVGKLSSGCVILCITTRRGTINRLNKVYKGKT